MKSMLAFWLVFIITATLVSLAANNAAPPKSGGIHKIDDLTYYWQKDSTLVLMKVIPSGHDTVALYNHYKLVKRDIVHDFNLSRFEAGLAR